MNRKASQHAERAQTEKSQGPSSQESLSLRNGRQQIVDLEFLRGLIEAVDESGIDSLEISRGGTRIRIAKTAPAAAVSPLMQTYTSAPPVREAGPAPAGAPASPGAATPAETGGAAAMSNLIEIKSPMVGTFYRSPAPEAPPYVELGSRIVKGQTLCILEAMKLMNELESEVAGTVREVCVENAEPVEYGQVLFRIEPNA